MDQKPLEGQLRQKLKKIQPHSGITDGAVRRKSEVTLKENGAF